MGVAARCSLPLRPRCRRRRPAAVAAAPPPRQICRTPAASTKLCCHTCAGPLAEKLAAQSKRLSASVPDAPQFPPHVTLIGGVKTSEADVLARAAALAQQLIVCEE